MIEQITAEVAVIGVNRTDKGCFVRLEIHSPDELEPFFQAKGGQYMAVLQRVNETAEPTEVKPQRMSVLAYKLCESPKFWKEWGVSDKHEAASVLKHFLSIEKRAELDNIQNTFARTEFAKLLRSKDWFQDS